jgi:tripartite-type tricarboxylate transporter receptor subunit TctC
MKTLVALILGICAHTSFASVVVPVIWPFSPVSTQANMIRALIADANSSQSEYTYVFTHKPGAGGSIAVNTVLTTENVILVSTSSFYIRPLLFDNSHDVNRFDLIGAICSNQPLAIFSSTYSHVDQLKNKSVTVGVIPGSITNLVTRGLARQSISISDVFYKGTPEATVDVLGGHLDLSVDFLGEARITSNPRIKILGITGTTSYGKYRSLSELGITGLENITNSYYVFVSKNIDGTLRNTTARVFSNSKYTPQVKQLCEKDYGQQRNLTQTELNIMHTQNKNFWKNISTGLVIK